MAAGDPLLGRAVWTDADFDQMGWHDVRVHAIGFFEDDLETPAELALDIDYIVRWIDPEPPDEYFTFDIAPATLVFSDVWGLEGELQAFQRTLLTIDGIERGEPESELQEQKGMRPWTVTAGEVELRFVARGFSQHFRARPILAGHRQWLTGDERGGYSFERPAALPKS
jgi:hypothetical protein